MIPDAAVEAAAYALYLDANPDSETQWFDITFHDQDELMRTARAALEAAAPHIAACVWDEAVAAAAARQERVEYQLQAPDESVDDAPLVNPYRKAAK